ncbi:phosphoribosyltransferase [Mycolicibacterium rhodesiae]|uniref:Phosphoribosyltransferase n=1 Tax=Mycolicibacterium rhodesiae TaxID=36814 RepID=A0A1X0IYW5_MYCRH|nr:phosphoribosyltransferase [Mycolicibacterium rhodesiae]ORB53793.1 phosphoribosyltransferase [Mycolicibacterium rhodesiae]
MQRFADRADAGRQLAESLAGYRDADVLVLGLPRGGVPVAFEVAKALAAPLDVLVVRKLGVPGQPELAFGAIGEDGVRVINEAVLRHVVISDAEIAEVDAEQRTELARRVARYRGGKTPLPLAGRVVLIIDDGFATGSTARAACLVARARGAAKVVLAAPIGAPDTIAELRSYADEVVCPGAPRNFSAVGQGYDDFRQTSDEQVTALLERAKR